MEKSGEDMSETLKAVGMGGEDIKRLLNEHQKTHGEFHRVAFCAQHLRNLFRGTENWYKMSFVQREVFDAWAEKMARVLCGDPNFKEHVADIIGYAELYLRDIATDKESGG